MARPRRQVASQFQTVQQAQRPQQQAQPQQIQGRAVTSQNGQMGITGRGGNFQALGAAAQRRLGGMGGAGTGANVGAGGGMELSKPSFPMPSSVPPGYGMAATPYPMPAGGWPGGRGSGGGFANLSEAISSQMGGGNPYGSAGTGPGAGPGGGMENGNIEAAISNLRGQLGGMQQAGRMPPPGQLGGASGGSAPNFSPDSIRQMINAAPAAMGGSSVPSMAGLPRGIAAQAADYFPTSGAGANPSMTKPLALPMGMRELPQMQQPQLGAMTPPPNLGGAGGNPNANPYLNLLRQRIGR